MKSIRILAGAVIVLLLVAAGYGIFRTRPPASPSVDRPLSATSQSTTNSSDQPLVDQSALATARRLAQTPNSPAEVPFATEALRLADQEMDLAFATAVREAAEHPPALSAEAKQFQAKQQKAENALDADKAQVAQLTAAEAKASGSRKDALDDQLDLAKAQLELDQDEIDDAKQDLIRAGGDLQGRIQAMTEQHEAASQSSDSTKVSVSEPKETHGMVPHLREWWAFHQKQMQLWQAKRDAETAVATLAARHNVVEQKGDAANQQAPPPDAPPPPAGSPATAAKP